MHLNLSFHKYIKILYELMKLLFKSSGNLKNDLTKIISFVVYIAIYIYSVYQTFVISYIIIKTREKLLAKIKGLVDFIKTSIVLIKRSNYIWKPFFLYNYDIDNINESLTKLEEITYDLSTIYKLWKNDNYKSYITTILKVVYTLDVINVITKLKKNKYWCIPTFNNNNIKIWGIRNPLLIDNQVPNPVNLNKNMIITGVNAGGKTTYVKAIASNIILAQSLGIINALKGDLYLYDAVISFMRISDEVGVKSYFEAETNCCSNMIEIADDLYKNNKKGLFVLDEPMHSTPPIEGMSVAYSIAKYLGNMNGINVIITTHFHRLMELENECNDKFINLSVNAYKNNDKYEFDYKINRGGSRQTIAIELLKKHKLHDEIINSAIEMKNKLCNENLRNDF
jgi:DNA mismatch repair ATPase MutS